MGLGCRADDWGEVFPARLAEQYRVIRFDNRGAGASSKPSVSWTLEDMADDALRVLDAEGVGAAHVVGISMGGMISQLIALDHPARCKSLVLMSTHAGGSEVIAPTSEAFALFQPPRGTTAEQIMRLSVRVLTAPGFAKKNPESVEALVRYAVEQPTPRRAFSTQLQAIFASDRAQRLQDIRVPTLVLHGDSDSLIPDGNGRLLAQRIPGAELEIVPTCGHMPTWEAPDAVSRRVLEFLARRG
jgi:pimeloyl-ACP methyl ester carboxylesterase